MKLVSSTALHVTTITGGAIRLEANVPREVPVAFVSAALAAGARPVGEAPVVEDEGADEDSEEDRLPRVIAAMQTILESGDPKKLTAAQLPRAAEVDRICGFTTSQSERDAAWAAVEA